MNYLPEQQNNDVEKVIQQVFQISGVKLTVDDPIVAVLVLQEKKQTSASIQLQEEIQILLDSVSEIKKYREQVLIELMSEAKRTSEETEEKIIGLMSKYFTEFETFQHQLHHKTMTSKIYLCTVGVAGIVIGIALHSLF